MANNIYKINFSVIIPLYNKELSICPTIESVLSQTFKDFEIIVVNDGSTDGSLKNVSLIKDPRLKILNKSNGGVSSARNLGIINAQNNYIAFLDGDDLWAKDHLEILSKMINEYPDEVMYYTKFGSLQQVNDRNFELSINKTSSYLFEFVHGNFAWTGTVCFQKNHILKNHLLFNETLSHGEDLDFWCRASLERGAVYCNMYTAIYRQDSENRATSLSKDCLSKRYGYVINKSDFKNIEYGLDYYDEIIKELVMYYCYTRNIKHFFMLAKKHGFFLCFKFVLKYIYNLTRRSFA